MASFTDRMIRAAKLDVDLYAGMVYLGLSDIFYWNQAAP